MTEHYSPEAEQAFNNHIWSEFNKAKSEAPSIIPNQFYLDTGCIDELTRTKGMWNPPGGGFFLLDEGYLTDWMETRKNTRSVIGIHKYCGYLYTIQGIIDIREQERYLSDFQNQFKSLNRQLGTHHRYVVENNGSAKPFMR